MDEWIDATRMDLVESTQPPDLGSDAFTGSNTSAVLAGSNPEICIHIAGSSVILVRIHFWAKNFDRVVIQPYETEAGTTPIASAVSNVVIQQLDTRTERLVPRPMTE